MVNRIPTLLPEKKGEKHFEICHKKSFEEMQKKLDKYG
jgi:hypothetical protein